MATSMTECDNMIKEKPTVKASEPGEQRKLKQELITAVANGNDTAAKELRLLLKIDSGKHTHRTSSAASY